MKCVACGRGFHKECLKGCKKCHVDPVIVELPEEENDGEDSPVSPKKLNLRDESSTGRKRAAQLYKINPDDPCEWRGKRNCGGGRVPIIGCFDGKQQHRHHGPVKRTTRNEQGNVHRICTSCHVHWHELNDLVYDEKDYNLLPHLPVDCDTAILLTNIAEWKSGEMARKYTLASTKNKSKKLEIEDE